MHWEPRFVTFDEDSCIEIVVMTDSSGQWHWQAIDYNYREGQKGHVSQTRWGYKTAAGARRAAQRWYARFLNGA